MSASSMDWLKAVGVAVESVGGVECVVNSNN
jgi:hypothetical protein